MELSIGEVQEILRIFAESDLLDLRLQIGDVRLEVAKDRGGLPRPEPAAFAPAVSAAGTPTEARKDHGDAIGAQQRGAPDVVAQAAHPATVGGGGTTPRPQSAHLVELKSTLVGVFYRRSAPDKPPYVEVGDVVAAGDPVCTVEVMKMFTQISAEQPGRVVEICVADGAVVEFGQTLMIFEPLPETA